MSLISKNNLGKIVTKGIERPIKKEDFYVSGMVIHVKDRKTEYDCVVFTKKDIENAKWLDRHASEDGILVLFNKNGSKYTWEVESFLPNFPCYHSGNIQVTTSRYLGINLNNVHNEKELLNLFIMNKLQLEDI